MADHILPSYFRAPSTWDQPGTKEHAAREALRGKRPDRLALMQLVDWHTMRGEALPDYLVNALPAVLRVEKLLASEDRRNQVLALRNSGAKRKAIADELDISLSQVDRLSKPREEPPTDVAVAGIIERGLIGRDVSPNKRNVADKRAAREDRFTLFNIVRRLSKANEPLPYRGWGNVWWALAMALELGDRHGPFNDLVGRLHGGLRLVELYRKAARIEGLARLEAVRAIPDDENSAALRAEVAGRNVISAERLEQLLHVDKDTLLLWRQRPGWELAVRYHAIMDHWKGT